MRLEKGHLILYFESTEAVGEPGSVSLTTVIRKWRTDVNKVLVKVMLGKGNEICIN